MATNLSTIRGISPEVVSKMNARGIKTTEDLLNAAQTPAARRELAATSGIEGPALTELLNRAELARLKGVGDAFANLLEEAGVDSIKELAHRKPESLHTKLVELNTQLKIAHHVPPVEVITEWINEAKSMSQAGGGA